MLTGTYLDPGRGRLTIGELAQEWLDGKVNLEASTRARYESALTVHVLPRWGTTRVDQVRHGAVQAWVAALSQSGQSAESVKKVYNVLSGILAFAVQDRRIPANAAAKVNLPRAVQRPRRYLTADQVSWLATAAIEPPNPKLREAYAQNGLIVLVFAFCGLRFSELAGLRVSAVDPAIP